MQKITYKTLGEILKRITVDPKNVQQKPIPASHWIVKTPLNGYYHTTEEGLVIEQIAYECPTCDYVQGKPKRTKTDTLDISRNPGVNLDCYVCGTHLGEVQYVDE